MLIVPRFDRYSSPRSHALAERLRSTINESRMREPKLTEDDVAAELRAASHESVGLHHDSSLPIGLEEARPFSGHGTTIHPT